MFVQEVTWEAAPILLLLIWVRMLVQTHWLSTLLPSSHMLTTKGSLHFFYFIIWSFLFKCFIFMIKSVLIAFWLAGIGSYWVTQVGLKLSVFHSSASWVLGFQAYSTNSVYTWLVSKCSSFYSQILLNLTLSAAALLRWVQVIRSRRLCLLKGLIYSYINKAMG